MLARLNSLCLPVQRISLWLGISGSLAIVVAVTMIRVVTTISSVTQSMITQSIAIITIEGISLGLGLWGAETASDSQGEDNL